MSGALCNSTKMTKRWKETFPAGRLCQKLLNITLNSVSEAFNVIVHTVRTCLHYEWHSLQITVNVVVYSLRLKLPMLRPTLYVEAAIVMI